MKPYPPLATLLAAALLRERGHDIAFFDAMLAADVDAFTAALERERPAVVGILEDNFNFLTKMCTLRMREATLAMVRAAHERGCRVAVNGSDAVDRPEIYLEAGADAVILGEAERAFAEVAERWLASGDALGDVAGLALPAARAVPPARRGGAGSGRSDHTGDAAARSGRLPVLALNGAGAGGASGVRRTPARTAEQDLDALPFPAWDLVDVEAYRTAWTRAHGRLSWNVVTSRGCPYGCNWCAKPVFGRRYSQRSPASVAEELARLRREVAPDHVWFADDIFGLTPAWIEAFGEEVRRRGARIPFMIQSRVNLMRPAAVAALAAAGAEEVWMGVESGSQAVLDAMEKGSTVQQARDATRTLKAHGVRACWFIQLGYPGEGWPEIVQTRDLLREERPDDVGVSVAYPLPGTRFHERVAEELGVKRNWADTDDLAMLFHGTYTTPFYRRVRTLLHDEARADGPPRAVLDARWSRLAAEEARHRSPRATRVAVG